MKKIAFILLLFGCSLSWAQQFIVTEKAVEKPKVTSDEEYNKLLNYIPKSFVSDIKTKPHNRVLQGDLNTIGSLELRYAYLGQLNLNPTEIKWLEDEINALAIAFFTEGKPIIIKRAGNYNDCSGRSIATEMQKGVAVTLFKFCYTYPGGIVYEDRFVEIFNNRTEKLIAAQKQ